MIKVKTVMIVEDDKIISEELTHLLETSGYNVITLTNYDNTLEDISQGDTQYMDIGDTGEIPTEFEDISSYSTGKPAEKGDGPGSESDVNVDISSVSRSVPDPKAANPYGQAMPVVKRAPREGAQVPPARDRY